MKFAKLVGFMLLWFPLFVLQELRARLRGDIVLNCELPFTAREQMRTISRSFVQEFYIYDPSFRFSSSDDRMLRVRGRLAARGNVHDLVTRVRAWARSNLPEGSSASARRLWRRATA